MIQREVGTDVAVPSDNTVRVTIQDARELGFCVGGTRTFLERHGLDFKAFLRDGLDAQDLLATGDAMAERVVAHAHGKRA
jgi:hypothetical protein